MNRRYHISKDAVMNTYMYSHYQSCGWKYCVVVEDAWKFMATLRQCNAVTEEQQLGDYLIIECNTLEYAQTMADCIRYATSNDEIVSVWYEGHQATQ